MLTQNMKRQMIQRFRQNHLQMTLLGGALNAEEETVLEYARTHGSVTRNEVIKLLEVSASTASRVLKKMVKRNLLKQNGKARSTNYTIVKYYR